MRTRTTRSPSETRSLGRELARELVPDGTLLLTGDLGSGKTVLAQGVGEELGLAPEAVVSPTFTLIAEHEAPGGRLIHADLYRLEPAEVEALGLEELLSGGGVKVVEWAERLPFSVPGARHAHLVRLADGSRRIEERLETNGSLDD